MPKRITFRTVEGLQTSQWLKVFLGRWHEERKSLDPRRPAAITKQQRDLYLLIWTINDQLVSAAKKHMISDLKFYFLPFFFCADLICDP